MIKNSKSILEHADENEDQRKNSFLKISEKEILIFSCIAIFCIHFIIGVVTYGYIEDLSVLDAFYFCVITLTTTGYGDILPTKNSSKLFTAFYIFFGLGLVVSSIGWISAWIQLKQEQLRVSIATNFLKDENHFVDDSDSDSDDSDEDDEDDEEKPKKDKNLTQKTSNKITTCFGFLRISSIFASCVKDLIIATLIILFNLFVGTIFYSYIVDSYNVVDSIYLSAVTIGTVGYGDITPSNDSSKLFTIFYCFFGSFITASALGMYNNAIFKYMSYRNFEQELCTDLSLGNLVLMDRNNDFSVTREEFIIYKLKRLKLIDDELCRQIDHQFNLLDKDGSQTLTAADIGAFNSAFIRKRFNGKEKSILSLKRGANALQKNTAVALDTLSVVSRKTVVSITDTVANVSQMTSQSNSSNNSKVKVTPSVVISVKSRNNTDNNNGIGNDNTDEDNMTSIALKAHKGLK